MVFQDYSIYETWKRLKGKVLALKKKFIHFIFLNHWHKLLFIKLLKKRFHILCKIYKNIRFSCNKL